MSDRVNEYPMDAIANDIRAWVASSLSWECRLNELASAAGVAAEPVTASPAATEVRARSPRRIARAAKA